MDSSVVIDFSLTTWNTGWESTNFSEVSIPAPQSLSQTFTDFWGGRGTMLFHLFMLSTQCDTCHKSVLANFCKKIGRADVGKGLREGSTECSFRPSLLLVLAAEMWGRDGHATAANSCK